MAYTIDTAAARAIVETVAVADDSLATKADLAALKTDLAALKTDLAALEAELTVRIIAAQVATATLLFAALRFL